MAKSTVNILLAIRNTAEKLESETTYQWGHMGSCNCGFLAQEVTKLTKDEIHRRAMEGYGDWNEQLNDYCPSSGLRMDDLISEMISFGFDTDDLKHLEKLSDANILKQLPFETRNLKHNVKSDVILYLRTWASMMEDEIADRERETSLIFSLQQSIEV